MQEYNTATPQEEALNLDDASFAELQDLQQLAGYQDAPLDDLDAKDTIEFDAPEEAGEAESSTESSFTMMSFPSRRSSSAFQPDASEALPHRRSIHTRSNFVLALGLFCEDAGISRKHWRSLREILRMLEPHPEISQLPESVSTLKLWAREQLPLLPMRSKKIPLVPAKLPSMKANLKANPTSGPPMETLYFFDPKALFAAFLACPSIKNKMHIGLGHFVDSPSELWHSDSWLTSIRTTSGQYAHLPRASPSDPLLPIFPSDFVYFTCGQLSCMCRETTLHLGRVHAVGRDYRSRSVEAFPEGTIMLRIHKVVDASECSSVRLQPNELLLIEDAVSYQSEEAVKAIRADILLDYSWESRVKTQQFIIPQAGQTFIRCVSNHGCLRPIGQFHPPRGELELAEFTRGHFVSKFDQQTVSVISVPLLTFIDGFGLYRNMYRTLMGVYLIIAAFSFVERARRSNVLPLTLGPHGSNFDDVVASLQSMYDLDGGMYLDINGEKTFVCIFTLAYLGDMPQQQTNSGFLSQRATLGCRFCFVPDKQRANINYDIITNGRYHTETMRMRKEMGSITVKVRQAKYGSNTGLAVGQPSLVTISPALDIIRSRPSDPAHSEYGGITKLLHILLMNAILTPVAQKEYTAVLRSFPYPSGWSRLQSPQHHLNSYRLQEHARWSIIAAGLLRIWLREKHVQPLFLQAMMTLHELDAEAGESGLAVDVIVVAFAAVAKSNAILMANALSIDDRSSLDEKVSTARLCFIELLEAAALAVTRNPRSRSATPNFSRADTPSHTMDADPTAAPKEPKKAEELRADQRRPNVHIGVHYADHVKEYGLASNCNVLIGEDKHRWFKQIVYNTNYSNVEKHLLSRENMQQTIRLALLGAFQDTEPAITTQLSELYDYCPVLFESLLPKSERAEEDFEDNDTLRIKEDSSHSRAKASHRLQPKHCREVLNLPIRSSVLHKHDTLRRRLRNAYEEDYGMGNVVEFGKSSLTWCKKFSFDDR